MGNLNKAMLMDPRLGNQHRTVTDPLNEDVSLKGLGIFFIHLDIFSFLIRFDRSYGWLVMRALGDRLKVQDYVIHIASTLFGA
ncbi:hypothetical protein H671_5g13801 [Cricetulus griseus]|nr:hypothetical protein H671_5g13801 [Cricetulus griseus]